MISKNLSKYILDAQYALKMAAAYAEKFQVDINARDLLCEAQVKVAQVIRKLDTGETK